MPQRPAGSAVDAPSAKKCQGRALLSTAGRLHDYAAAAVAERRQGVTA